MRWKIAPRCPDDRRWLLRDPQQAICRAGSSPRAPAGRSRSVQYRPSCRRATRRSTASRHSMSSRKNWAPARSNFAAAAHGCVPAEAAENRTFGGHGAGRKPATPRLCAKSRHQGGKKWGAARAPPKQCADNDNFQNMGDVVPCSFILPSQNPPLFAPKRRFPILH